MNVRWWLLPFYHLLIFFWQFNFIEWILKADNIDKFAFVYLEHKFLNPLETHCNLAACILEYLIFDVIFVLFKAKKVGPFCACSLKTVSSHKSFTFPWRKSILLMFRNPVISIIPTQLEPSIVPDYKLPKHPINCRMITIINVSTNTNCNLDRIITTLPLYFLVNYLWKLSDCHSLRLWILGFNPY